MPVYRDEAVVLRTHKLGEADRILTLPLFGHMTEEQQELVVTTLLAAVDSAARA